ncbi:hypothetical protein Tco_0887366 [Tanacetum coccineum]
MDDSLEKAATTVTSSLGTSSGVNTPRGEDEDMFGVNDLEGDEVIIETKVDHEVVVETEVASKDVTLKPKAKWLVIHEEEQATTPKILLKTIQVKVQDKGQWASWYRRPVSMKKKIKSVLGEEKLLPDNQADGSSKMYLVFSHMLKSFDREDLETLYKLVKAKYRSTRPVEDLDLVLYGDLKTMFEPHVEDTVWKTITSGLHEYWSGCYIDFME